MGVDDTRDDPAGRCEDCGPDVDHAPDVASTRCADCGHAIDDPRLRDGWRHRRPCPACGSTRRRHVIRQPVVASEVVDPDTDPLPLAARLLDLAARACETADFDTAVVLAHGAGEAAVQRAVAATPTARAGGSPRPAAPGRDPADETVRRWYESATGDELGALAEWAAFRHAANLRAAIERDGVTATEEQARAALAACDAVVRHVGARLGAAMAEDDADGRGARTGR